MAGGLFDKPFVINEKCIVFSLICMALFLYKPNFQNSYMLYFALVIIFIIAYVAMAWYDFYFDCKLLPLKKGEISLTGLFKPHNILLKKKDTISNNNNNNNKDDVIVETNRKKILIYMIHLIVIVPLLGYIAYYKTKINPIIYPLIGMLAVFTAIYHAGSLISSS